MKIAYTWMSDVWNIFIIAELVFTIMEDQGCDVVRVQDSYILGEGEFETYQSLMDQVKSQIKQ